eukprot:TRINITY_DN38132_c0_g1_i1.p1 TRINITY_DN38132_c0_g1~~TRINITY_DN38132_c0_g1_i1.p1  ORF type:complete len:304 (+),score=134.48 TRINITY_DN38132_c0_g1_i1:104-1015(+)
MCIRDRVDAAELKATRAAETLDAKCKVVEALQQDKQMLTNAKKEADKEMEAERGQQRELVDQAQKRSVELEEALEEAMSQGESALAQAKHLGEVKGRLEARVSTLEEELENTQRKSHDEAAALEFKIQEGTRQLNEMSEAMDRLEDANADLEASVSAKRAERDTALDKLDELEKEVQMLKYVEGELENLRREFDRKESATEASHLAALAEKDEVRRELLAEIQEGKQKVEAANQQRDRMGAEAEAAELKAKNALEKVACTEEEMRTLLHMMEQKRLHADENMRKLQDALVHMQTENVQASPGF